MRERARLRVKVAETKTKAVNSLMEGGLNGFKKKNCSGFNFPFLFTRTFWRA